MSMQPQPILPVPEDTAAVTRTAFTKGNLYLQIRDTLGSIYQDETFASLFSRRGQPAQSPWQLALVSVMQLMENLSDRQSRYVGLAKTHLQHILTAVALNLIRLGAWLSGVPYAQTRQSRLMELKPKVA